MMEGSSFSDEKVIEKIHAEFVALKLNVTEQGWPEELPGLALWEEAFGRDWRHRFGFATSVVLGPSGEPAFGTSGSGYRWEWETAINYHPEKYLAFLEGSRERFREAVRIDADTTLGEAERAAALARLRAEIVAQVIEANKRGRRQR